VGGRRAARKRQPSHLVTGLVLGLILGAGLAVGVLMAQRWSGERTSWGPAVPRRPAPEAPRAGAPAAPPPARPPALPAQNPEESQAPAVVQIPESRPAPAQPGRARVAIIFDDAGYGIRAAQEIMAIGRPVTISVLPHLPYSAQIAEEAPAHHVEVILHLPVEPDNRGIRLGEGGITVAMSDPEIRETVAADLASVPAAVGANNHMGSLGTADPRVMRAVMEEMKARHLFFIDSVTTRYSVAARVAREMGVPTAARAVFLDNQDTDDYVRGQFRLLMNLAHARGQAIAIGHVGKVTARVLVSLLPAFDEAGIQLVRVSDLAR